VIAILESGNDTLPLFVIVTVCAALGAPIPCVGKMREVGLKLTDCVPGVTVIARFCDTLASHASVGTRNIAKSAERTKNGRPAFIIDVCDFDNLRTTTLRITIYAQLLSVSQVPSGLLLRLVPAGVSDMPVSNDIA
jgi:hypothetical protein